MALSYGIKTEKPNKKGQIFAMSKTPSVTVRLRNQPPMPRKGVDGD